MKQTSKEYSWLDLEHSGDHNFFTSQVGSGKERLGRKNSSSWRHVCWDWINTALHVLTQTYFYQAVLWKMYHEVHTCGSFSQRQTWNHLAWAQSLLSVLLCSLSSGSFLTQLVWAGDTALWCLGLTENFQPRVKVDVRQPVIGIKRTHVGVREIQNCLVVLPLISRQYLKFS